MKSPDHAPAHSENGTEGLENIPVVDEELRLITSQLRMIDDRLADLDPRIHRGGPNAVRREIDLSEEYTRQIEEDTIDLKAVKENLLKELEEYYSSRTNQLDKEVKQEVEAALKKVLPDAIKGGGREHLILRSDGEIHPQILRALNTDTLSDLSRKKIGIMRRLYNPDMSEGEFVSLLMNPIKERILESLENTQTDNISETIEPPEPIEHRELTEEELTDIVRQKLSYQDAELPPEHLEAMVRDAEDRSAAKEYARHLSTLPEDTVTKVVPIVKSRMQEVCDELNIPVSPYGRSDSWVYWDLGKQQYYFEQNRDLEPQDDNPYVYAPVLEKDKLNEIVDRHIGWEFYHAPPEVREQALAAISDSEYLGRAFEILQNEPKADGQLPSHQYAELGKVLREYTYTKEIDDTPRTV